MRPTHQGPVEPSPLVYTITKAAELKNPLDPSEGTTGHTMMALTEVYRGLEGSQAHMESSAGWQDIGVMLEKVIANYSVGMIMHGEVVGSMADQIFREDNLEVMKK